MSDTSPGNGRSVQKAAESAILQLAARVGIVVLMTICLPFGAWVGSRLVTSLDRLTDSVSDIKLELVGVKRDIEYLKAR